MSHPFQKKLSQVAIVVRDIEAARKRYADFLGVPEPEIIITEPGSNVNLKYRGHASNDAAKLAFFDLGGVALELIEPIGNDSAWAEGLDEKGERVHHLAFWTEDMKAAKDHLDEHGAPMIMRGDMGEGQYAYFDGIDNFGCFFEILEQKRTPLEDES